MGPFPGVERSKFEIPIADGRNVLLLFVTCYYERAARILWLKCVPRLVLGQTRSVLFYSRCIECITPE